MIEKPPTVLALFEGHPERWIHGTFCRDITGKTCWYNGKNAASFCLSGAIAFVYGKRPATGEEWKRMDAYLGMLPSTFNDKIGRTFDEIVEACRAAGI